MNRLDLSQFEIIEKLGAGSYGKVMKAREKSTGEIVAMKFINTSENGNGVPRAAFDEIQALQQVRWCPNICRLENSFKTSKGLCLVSEYCEYDLQGLRSLTDISVMQFKSMVRQILTGLNAIHEAGLMHRDLKPENILMTARNEVKIADFGLARSYKDVSLRRLTADIGTRSYQAPELLLGSTNYGPAIDIWSLGCVLYFLITNKVLFPVNERNEVVDSLVTKRGSPDCDWPEYKSFPNKNVIQTLSGGVNVDFQKYLAGVLPRKFRDASTLIAKMLSWDPEKRITAKEALADPYLNEGEELASLPVSSVHERHDSKKKERTPFAKHCLAPTLGSLHLRGLPPPVCA